MKDMSQKQHISKGLTAAEVIKSRETHGSNGLESAAKTSFFRKFIGNLSDPIIRILLIALTLNIVLTIRNIEWAEVIGIAAAITIATLVSTISEHGSEKAFERLRQSSASLPSKVMRDGEIQEISEDQLVVGDIVYLSAGDKIPADGRVISGEVRVDQSALTGESREIRKRAAEDNIPPFDLESADCLFRGSLVCDGSCVMEVVRVGEATLYGSIATELGQTTRKSPLKLRLEKLARSLSRIGYAAGGIVAAAYLFNVLVISNNFDWNIISHYITDFGHLTHQITRALTIGIAIMVVSVPEGLPMMITVVLSSNMKRMMRDNVLVKKLVGIETAGSLNLLFTDKTGTITRGVLTAHRLVLADGSEFADVSQLRKAPAIHRLFVMNARYNATSEPTFTEGGCVMAGGNATEKSIFQFAQQDVGMYNASVDGKTMFNSERKFSSVTLSGDSGREVTLVKGATEAILSRCTKYINATGEVRPFGPNIPGGGYAKLGATVNEIAHAAGRVIAIAYSEGVAEKDTLPQDMILVGIVAIRDQLRPEAQKSIRQLRSAGIQPVMITGDSIDTARAIATECGILTPNSNSLVITSTELAAMTDGEIRAAMPRLAVVARALPSDKSRLVRIAQEAELVVGMTGDGINDAPALKRADVGFAMGSGTEIAREAGDIVILDNNLASITKAVLYGRTIFKSIRKFITFQLTMNLCAVGVSFLGQLLGVGTPITVVQMLWVNIIMDTLGGLAFAGEPPLASYMKEPPKRRDESILTRGMVQQIWTMGVFAVTLCSLFLASRQAQNHFDFFYNEIYFYTAFYALFIFTGVIICFISRSERINLLANIGRNKLFLLIMAAIMVIQIAMLFFGGEVFRTAGMSGGELAFVFGLSLLVLPMDFLRRLWVKQRK